MSNQKNNSNLQIWRLLAVVVILLYAAGMFLMIFKNFGNGVTLWALSTILGGLALYVKRTNDKKAADEKEYTEAEAAYQKKLQEEQQNQEQK